MFNTDDVLKIWKILKDAWKIEEYKTILELQEKLFLYQDENITLKKQNSELQEKIDLKSKITFDKNTNYCFLEWDENPICSICWYDKQKTIPLWFDKQYWDYSCLVCWSQPNPNQDRFRIVTTDYYNTLY